MRRVYLEEVIKKAASDTDDYIYDLEVEPGKVLEITHMSCWWADIAITEVVKFFVEDMGRKLYLADDKPAVIGGPARLAGDVLIGEGDRAGAYSADIAADDVVHFVVVGILWDRDDWQHCRMSLPG